METTEHVNNSENNGEKENPHWQIDLIRFRKKIAKNENIEKVNTTLWKTATNKFNAYYNTQWENQEQLIQGSSALLDMRSFNWKDFTSEIIKRFIFQGHEPKCLNKNQTELSKKGILKLNNIIHTTVQYCKEEGLNDHRFIKKYDELKQELTQKTSRTILHNALVQTKGKGGNEWKVPRVNSLQWNKESFINIQTTQKGQESHSWKKQSIFPIIKTLKQLE